MTKAIEVILTASEVRRRAQHMVALDGGWADTGLDQKELDTTIEEAIQAEEKKIESRPGVIVYPDNNLPGYGVNEEDLAECFKSRAQGDKNYHLLKLIWNGISYVETENVSGVPHEMLSAKNTVEILSHYRGFGKLIRDGYIATEDWKITKEQLKEMSAEQVVSKLVSYGCRYKAMSDLREKGYTGFPTGSGDLIKRIRALNKQVKDRFMRLLDIPEPEVPPLGKNEYIEGIAFLMKKVHKANTPKKHK